MEPVYCPNGHPNRPGTRLCAVCLALIEPSAPAAPPPKKTPRPPLPPAVSSPPAEKLQPAPPAAPQPDSAPSSRRVWPWLLGCLLLITLGVVAVVLLLFPLVRSVAPAPTAAPPTAASATVAAIAPAAVVAEPTVAEATAAATLPSPGATADAGASPDMPSPTTVATITPLATLVGVVITPTFAFGPDDNLIQNGDFNDDWVNGWTREATARNTGTVEVRPLPDAPDDSALFMEQSGPDVLHLAQRVVLAFPVEGLIFRARVRLAGAADAAGQGRAALILRYEDAAGQPLGASVWLDDSAETTPLWGNGPLPAQDLPVVAHPLAEGWQAVEVALGSELRDDLPQIDPVAVRQLTISLALLGEDGCAPAACAAALEASQLSLTAEMP